MRDNKKKNPTRTEEGRKVMKSSEEGIRFEILD